MRQRIVDAAWELARERGLTGFSLRDLGERVGMRAPSLFVYFDGKNALYDAMFDGGWAVWRARRVARRWPPRTRPRARMRAFAREFVRFAVEDPVRYQLLNQRVVPGFEPSAASWAAAVADRAELVGELAAMGIAEPEEACDLYTALLGGLIAQQLANDPGGTRWIARTGEVIDMWCDRYGVGVEEGRR